MKKHWPVLSYTLGKPTYETLQLFTQIVGKIKLATMPWINHSWGSYTSPYTCWSDDTNDTL
ncbi:DUF5996 family protein [Flavobacterium sp. KBS0721]|uniref:DUF5996 family protein n=1 Tax=Flavobacterium sp. KBS0721 TaxID=1179672 RepID=UPI0026D5AD0C